ncbi:MAG TPA: FecR domain-containing protein [Polyangiaceae bacterium]|nr:FecR domain-containing protein [Polyangiaceae bacterium]
MSALAERFERLGREIAAEQDRGLAQDLSLGSVRSRVVGRRFGRPRRVRAWASAAVLAAAAAAAALYHFARPHTPLEATLGTHPLAVGEWVSATEVAAPPIHFSDGSEVTLLPGSRARLATLDAVGAHLVLESGAANVRVTPNHGARYRLSLGPFAVDVTGTRFDVGFRPSDELFTLALHEGKVSVSGCVLGEGRTLLAGESLSASCRAGHFEISALGSPPAPSSEPTPTLSAAPSPEPADTALEPSEPELRPARPLAVGREATAAASNWQSLSRQGRFADAYALIELDGFDAAVSKATIADLALLGDTARFVAKPRDALKAYQALRSRGAGSAAAKQAAFSIARVHFDQRAAYAEAARWFRTYLAEQPGGPLAREAEGRLMESLSRAGDRSGARQVAEKYVALYPRGPHERFAQQLLAR